MWRILKVLILKSCWFATDSIIIIITIDINNNNNNNNKTSFLDSLSPQEYNGTITGATTLI